VVTGIVTVDDYIAGLPCAVQPVAIELRALILAAAPGATDAIAYTMPAFISDGVPFLYFACWKKHVGLYPVYRGGAEFEALVAPYRAKKDTVQFKYGEPIPRELVARIVAHQVGNGC
jgi:uncharacterized protein YdhG (YjbR/CyaY superfamily)